MRPLALLALLLHTLVSRAATATTLSNLLPWEINVLNTFSPSGRPGNAPYSTLYVSITDPNTIPAGFAINSDVSFQPSSANCTVRWNSYDPRDDPFAFPPTPCPDSGFTTARWTVQLLKQNNTGSGPSATRDFQLKFVLEQSMVLNDGVIMKEFEGIGSFAIGKELGFVCGGSGVCNAWLKDESVNMKVSQDLVDDRCFGWRGEDQGPGCVLTG